MAMCRKVLQFRPVKTPFQVSLLDFLDYIPTDAQVVGDILDGHVPQEFQGVPLKGFGVRHAGIGKANLDLSDDFALAALHPGDRQIQVHRFAANGNRPEATNALPSAKHVFRPASRTATRLPWLLDPENHRTLDILSLPVPVATHPKCMVK